MYMIRFRAWIRDAVASPASLTRVTLLKMAYASSDSGFIEVDRGTPRHNNP
jgi:hypothetical protein